jgi:tRNA (cmo5U34)-methyltransferase
MGQYKPMDEFFDDMSGEYDAKMREYVEGFEEFYSSIAAAVPETDAELSILDIGCGTGLELAAVFHRAPNALITGVDLSGEMLNILRDKYTDYLNQITLIQESYVTFSYEEALYDFVISAITAHHLLPANKQVLYRKIRKALKPGGKYIEGDYITTPEKEKQIRRDFLKLRASDPDLVDGTHHIDLECSLETQKGLLLKAGFARVDVLWEYGETAVYSAST